MTFEFKDSYLSKLKNFEQQFFEIFTDDQLNMIEERAKNYSPAYNVLEVLCTVKDLSVLEQFLAQKSLKIDISYLAFIRILDLMEADKIKIEVMNNLLAKGSFENPSAVVKSVEYVLDQHVDGVRKCNKEVLLMLLNTIEDNSLDVDFFTSRMLRTACELFAAKELDSKDLGLLVAKCNQTAALESDAGRNYLLFEINLKFFSNPELLRDEKINKMYQEFKFNDSEKLKADENVKNIFDDLIRILAENKEIQVTNLIGFLIDKGYTNSESTKNSIINAYSTAIHEGRKEALVFCIKYGKEYINEYDSNGNTPFLHAVIADNVELVQLLVEAGADTELTTKPSEHSAHPHVPTNWKKLASVPKVKEIEIGMPIWKATYAQNGASEPSNKFKIATIALTAFAAVAFLCLGAAIAAGFLLPVIPLIAVIVVAVTSGVVATASTTGATVAGVKWNKEVEVAKGRNLDNKKPSAGVVPSGSQGQSNGGITRDL